MILVVSNISNKKKCLFQLSIFNGDWLKSFFSPHKTNQINANYFQFVTNILIAAKLINRVLSRFCLRSYGARCGDAIEKNAWKIGRISVSHRVIIELFSNIFATFLITMWFDHEHMRYTVFVAILHVSLKVSQFKLMVV